MKNQHAYTAQQRNSATAQQRNSATAKLLNPARYIMMLIFVLYYQQSFAQVFRPTSTAETICPNYSFNPVAPTAIPGLYASSAYSGLFSNVAGGSRFAEISAWTEDDGAGWENGTVVYGYTDNTGIFNCVDTISIPGAKHLSAAYMQAGGVAYIIAAYTVRIQAFASIINPIDSCPTVPAGYSYAHEYRVYAWPTLTSAPLSLASIGRISNLFPTSYAICHPLYGTFPGWYGDFGCDGTLVMDVNIDRNRVAFAWTGNCAAVHCTAGELSPAGTLSINIASIAPYPAANPADVAFRRDPSTMPAKDYIHTLIPDGSGNYFVTQDEFNPIYLVLPPVQRIDDASMGGSFLMGTPLTGGMVDHAKLDVPDVSAERRWAYTWSDGSNIFLRRFVAASSLVPSSPMSSSTTEVLNDGTLAATAPPFYVQSINSVANQMPAISYTQDATGTINKQQIVWRSRANEGTTGVENWVGIKVQELAPWPAPVTAISDLDYLDIQSTNTNRATEYIALSHNSNSIPMLYTSFMEFDNIGSNNLKHKNHDFTNNSLWRKSEQQPIAAATIELVNIAPNPFTSNINIRTNVPLTCKLTDVTGRNLATFSGEEAQLNASLNNVVQSLSSGTYLLHTLSDSGKKNVFKLNKL